MPFTSLSQNQHHNPYGVHYLALVFPGWDDLILRAALRNSPLGARQATKVYECSDKPIARARPVDVLVYAGSLPSDLDPDDKDNFINVFPCS